MKELIKNYSDKIEIVKQQQKKTEIKFSHSIKPHKGHTLFEINTITFEIKKAIFRTKDACYLKAIRGELFSKKDVIMNENCVYISALNEKNAFKKLFKELENDK